MGPLTPAVISKLPRGLLGFFGIKNGGQYPQSLGNVISPTMDLTRLLAANYFDNQVATHALPLVLGNNPGVDVFGQPATVPASELWFVSHLGIVTFTGAGDAVNAVGLLTNFQTGAASNWHVAVTPQVGSGASSTQMHPGSMGDAGRWLSPGDRFGFWVSSITNATGTIQLSMNYRVTKFPY